MTYSVTIKRLQSISILPTYRLTVRVQRTEPGTGEGPLE
jgi:hypothetical protein